MLQQTGNRENVEDQVVEDNATPSYETIDKLQDGGINVTDIKRMKEFGLFTIGSVLNVTIKDLCSIKGFTEAKVDKIRECCKVSLLSLLLPLPGPCR